MTKQPEDLWKPYKSGHDRFGVLFVEEVPRHYGESGENYCRRVAKHYTLQAGVEYRNERLKQHHAEGISKEQLADMYGLRMQEMRELLYQLELEKRPEPPKPITADIKAMILRMRKAGKSYSDVEAATGIKQYRAASIWGDYERDARYRKAKAERLRKQKLLSDISSTPPSILEHLEDFDGEERT
jgi:hypothetical protein